LTPAEFTSQFERYRKLTEAALESLLPTGSHFAEMQRYSVLGDGKRLRGILVLAFCEASSGNVENALPLAAAVEILHAYSLIHDDLPCMDNDDFRRGKPSAHKQFGEWQALLTGDALQALAFKLTSGTPNSARAVRILSDAAYAICYGQYLDLSGDDNIELLTLNKTAALFKAACLLGNDSETAEIYGLNFGLTFQIRDDILDRDGYFARYGEAHSRDLMERYLVETLKAAPSVFLSTLAKQFSNT